MFFFFGTNIQQKNALIVFIAHVVIGTFSSIIRNCFVAHLFSGVLYIFRKKREFFVEFSSDYLSILYFWKILAT